MCSPAASVRWSRIAPVGSDAAANAACAVAVLAAGGGAAQPRGQPRRRAGLDRRPRRARTRRQVARRDRVRRQGPDRDRHQQRQPHGAGPPRWLGVELQAAHHEPDPSDVGRRHAQHGVGEPGAAVAAQRRAHAAPRRPPPTPAPGAQGAVRQSVRAAHGRKRVALRHGGVGRDGCRASAPTARRRPSRGTVLAEGGEIGFLGQPDRRIPIGAAEIRARLGRRARHAARAVQDQCRARRASRCAPNSPRPRNRRPTGSSRSAAG